MFVRLMLLSVVALSVTDVSADTPSFDPAKVSETAAAARQSGNAERGISVFGSTKTACVSCHRIGKHGGSVGPDLSRIGKERTVEEIVESILWPGRKVDEKFRSVVVLTTDGLQVRGYPTEAEAGHVAVRDPATGKVTQIANDDVDEQIPAGTLMPDALATAMSPAQLHDVVSFLSALGTDRSVDPELIDSVLAHSLSHAPATFAFTKPPLRPDVFPQHQHFVNRDRVYEFYTKQAEHFRQADFRPPLLAPYPGLDGGVLGHWGNQNEGVWANDDWNKTDRGRLASGVTRTEGLEITRGICVRLGDDGDVSACFNPDTLTWAAAWTGDFVETSAVRHGFMDGLAIKGSLLELPEQQTPTKPFQYRGLYRHGERVILAYRIGETDYLDAPWAENGKFTHVVAPADEHPLKHLTEASSDLWPQQIEVSVSTIVGEPFAVDSIDLPVNNPWKVPVYPGDHDFLPDGSALVCTMQGDVWHVTGLTGESAGQTAVWKRFASGLHQALGLLVDDDGIFVLCRDQIVCLHDLNQDGCADFYECFSNKFQSSPAGHDFICGLQRDDQGRFYIASGQQGLVRVAADGNSVEVLAVGFRNPDGLGLHPDGTVTVPCSEGNYTPASQICGIRPDRKIQTTVGDGKIGQHQPAHFGYGGGLDKGAAPDLPMVYLPRGLDNSAGGQCVIRSDQWGALNGNMIHTSFGTGTHFLLLKDDVAGQLQGAIVPLPAEFLSGAHRARFNAKDGHLYVSGMGGWGTYTPHPGCFHRVRRTGRDLQLPSGFHVHSNGVSLEFTETLDPQVAANPAQYFAQCWNYRFSPAYGSQEYSPGHPGTTGHDTLEIRSAHVSKDGHRLFLEIPDLQPVNQLHLRLNPYANGPGADLFATVHRMDVPFTDFDGYQPVHKDVAAHPILADMALIKNRVPNPYRKKMKGARRIVLNTATNLSFATRQLTAKAGEKLQLTLKNPDVVPHNWALLKPGTLQSVGQQANRMVADPAGWARHYIPRTDDVLVYTDIVPAGKEFSVFFEAPQAPGRYPFLCTFPGHWMVMNGEMVVE